MKKVFIVSRYLPCVSFTWIEAVFETGEAAMEYVKGKVAKHLADGCKSDEFPSYDIEEFEVRS